MSFENEQLQKIKALGEFYESGITREYDFRISQLKGLYKLVEENREELCNALHQDLGKPKAEGYMMELMPIKTSISGMITRLDQYMQPEAVEKGVAFVMDTVETRRVPHGVVCIIGPWNFPLNLTLIPLVGAIGGGNAVILKPSELSLNTSLILEQLIPKYLDQRAIQIISGGIAETSFMLKQKFDFIFFTGSTNVGKIVTKAAAEHMTPVILELGGKCPVIIDSSVNVKIAANRVAWGKMMNGGGQICVAPDFVLIEKSIQSEFCEALKESFAEMLDSEKAIDSKYYGRIISTRHFDRLVEIINSEQENPNSTLVCGGNYNRDQLCIAPTVFKVTKEFEKHASMKEEIFGPILPVIGVDDVDEAIALIKKYKLTEPLTMHAFTKSKAVYEKVFKNINAGNCSVNECLMYLAIDDVPFGGVGNSGMGCYRGVNSFRAFTRPQLYFFRSISHDLMNFGKYPHQLGSYDSPKFRLFVALLEDKLPSKLKLGLIRLWRFIGGRTTLGLVFAFVVGIFVQKWLIK